MILKVGLRVVTNLLLTDETII